jgi:hypothetical protein
MNLYGKIDLENGATFYWNRTDSGEVCGHVETVQGNIIKGSSELAHIVLGHTKEGTMTDSEVTPRDTREVEAESVAYILCSILELPGLESSRAYVQGWLNGQQVSDKSASKIFGAANKILEAGK